jgi:hypothetical protein
MADSVDLIQSLSVLSLQPGDIVVLKCQQHLSRDAVDHLREVLKPKLGDHEVMILDGGLDIGVLRKEAAAS